MVLIYNLLPAFTLLLPTITTEVETAKAAASARIHKWQDELQIYLEGAPLPERPKKPYDEACDLLSTGEMTCSWGDCSVPGRGRVSSQDGTVYIGKWVQDDTGRLLMQGWGRVKQKDGKVMTGRFVDGCLEGIAYMKRQDDEYEFIIFATYEKNRNAGGPAWLFYQDKSYTLYVETPRPSQPLKKSDRPIIENLSKAIFTGDNVVFVYPDLKTALVGKFVAGTMLKAREALITEFHMPGEADVIDRLPSIEVEVVKENKAIFRADFSTEEHMTSNPMVRDPMEQKFLEVRKSKIPGAGVGVFAKQDIANSTIIGYFNGVLTRQKTGLSVYSAAVDDDFHVNVLDVYSKWENYQGSAGHLINHGTEDEGKNAHYFDCKHPRFGRILCIETTKAIPAGSELLVAYGRSIDKDSLKSFLHTALTVGHLFSGKSKQEFVKDADPYIQIFSHIVNSFENAEVRFPSFGSL